ncbi:MAG TPA: hypothetical protein PK765_01495 [bacterium]|nr:hypothetical protein [bacterium]
MEISYQQIRDLMPASESPERGSVDVSRAFGLAKVSSVRHAGRPMVRDLRGGTDLPLLAVRLEKIIVLSPSRPRSTESVALPARKKQSRGVHCVCAVAAVDLVRPLPPLRANSLDIRRLMPVSAIGIYPDLYRLPPPFATRVWRTVSAAVDIGVRASWRIAAAFVVSAGLIALVLFTVKSEIERGYETLMETRESSSLSAAYESL